MHQYIHGVSGGGGAFFHAPSASWLSRVLPAATKNKLGTYVLLTVFRYTRDTRYYTIYLVGARRRDVRHDGSNQNKGGRTTQDHGRPVLGEWVFLQEDCWTAVGVLNRHHQGARDYSLERSNPLTVSRTKVLLLLPQRLRTPEPCSSSSSSCLLTSGEDRNVCCAARTGYDSGQGRVEHCSVAWSLVQREKAESDFLEARAVHRLDNCLWWRWWWLRGPADTYHEAGDDETGSENPRAGGWSSIVTSVTYLRTTIPTTP